VEDPEASGRGRVALPRAGPAASIDALGGQVQQDRVDHPPRLGQNPVLEPEKVNHTETWHVARASRSY